MSEKAPTTPNTAQEFVGEGNELPGADDLLDMFESKRQDLEAALADSEAQPGFNLNANEIMSKRRSELELKGQLETLRQEWEEFGGDKIDEAQANVDSLDFKSDANDHISAKHGLREAKDAFYAKFTAAYEANNTPDEADTDIETDTVVDVQPTATPDVVPDTKGIYSDKSDAELRDRISIAEKYGDISTAAELQRELDRPERAEAKSVTPDQKDTDTLRAPSQVEQDAARAAIEAAAAAEAVDTEPAVVEAPATPESKADTNEDAPAFAVGDKVIVHTNEGYIEADWNVHSIDESEAQVIKSLGEGKRLNKTVSVEDLKRWNAAPEKDAKVTRRKKLGKWIMSRLRRENTVKAEKKPLFAQERKAMKEAFAERRKKREAEEPAPEARNEKKPTDADKTAALEAARQAAEADVAAEKKADQ